MNYLRNADAIIILKIAKKQFLLILKLAPYLPQYFMVVGLFTIINDHHFNLWQNRGISCFWKVEIQQKQELKQLGSNILKTELSL
jgi:hypothetical protein